MYAELFPETVGHLVLDGAVDPQLNAFDDARRADDRIRERLPRLHGRLPRRRRTARSPARSTRGLRRPRALLDTVDGLGLVASDGRELDSATVGTAIAMTLYSEDYWPYLSDMFNGVRAGGRRHRVLPRRLLQRPRAKTAATPATPSRSTPRRPASTTTSPPTPSRPSTGSTRSTRRHRRSASTSRSTTSPRSTPRAPDWPFPPADAPKTFDAKGAAPILVIGTSNDPATPYAWAKSLSEQLESGVLISVEGEGHTAYNQGNTCVDTTVDEYFLNDTVPDERPELLARGYARPGMNRSLTALFAALEAVLVVGVGIGIPLRAAHGAVGRAVRLRRRLGGLLAGLGRQLAARSRRRHARDARHRARDLARALARGLVVLGHHRPARLRRAHRAARRARRPPGRRDAATATSARSSRSPPSPRSARS